MTSAALVLAVTFVAFDTSEVSFIKLFGIGLATAVLVDATLVRAVLVPSLMSMAGRANWWSPSLRSRFGRLSVGIGPVHPSP